MRLVCLSDTHNRHSTVNTPDGDVLIHAGDFTGNGSIREVAAFGNWLLSQPHRHKIVVAGNHDWLFQKSPDMARALIEGAFYLEDSDVIIEGVKFYGSPWQPEFCNWAFNLPRGSALKAKWDMIPTDTDVLITHGPSYGVADITHEHSYDYLGCRDLRDAVERIKPKLHVCGHIHGGYGVHKSVGGAGTTINASICSESYNPINHPIIFDL